VARYGRAKVSLPGGCAIGARPVDQHLLGLEALGARIEVAHGFIIAECSSRLKGAEIVFDVPTVTGTENLMMAGALAKGRTTLVNAAREPEVEELGRVLNKMGARVEGAGTSTIHIHGADELEPFDHAIIADRIEAGTFMAAVGVAGGDVLLEHAPLDDLEPVIVKLRRAGLGIEREGDHARIQRWREAAWTRTSGICVVTSRPSTRSSSAVVSMSRKPGTLRSKLSPSESSVAHKIGSAAFFAPLTRIVPLSARAPRTRMASIRAEKRMNAASGQGCSVDR